MLQFLVQLKHIFLALSAITFPSDHIRNGGKFEKHKCICGCSFNFTAITAGQHPYGLQ